MRPYMYKANQSSFNIEKYFIFLKTTQLRIIYYSTIHCETQVLLFEMLFKFDFIISLNILNA